MILDISPKKKYLSDISPKKKYLSDISPKKKYLTRDTYISLFDDKVL